MMLLRVFFAIHFWLIASLIPTVAPPDIPPPPSVPQADCWHGDIEWVDNSPQLVQRWGLTDGTVRADVVGHYLWWQLGHKDDPDSTGDMQSASLTPGQPTVTICP